MRDDNINTGDDDRARKDHEKQDDRTNKPNPSNPGKSNQDPNRDKNENRDR